MISLSGVSLQFGSRVLYDDVNLSLVRGKRYGIVGANGTGKTTLLKLITGEEEPSLGQVSVQKDMKVGWLKQDHYAFENEPIVNVVLRGRPSLWKAMEKKEKLLAVEHFDEAAAHDLAEVEGEIERLDGYSAASVAETLLLGLGIETGQLDQPLKVLSGGYKLRVLLARALFDQPDILLLDEPTNYLDIVTIGWLEGYLRRDFQGLLLFISHDFDFLNNLATHTLDIDYGEVKQYTGNYDKFVEQKKAVEEQRAQELKSLEGKVAKMERFVERFRATPSKARQAQSRQKMIDKVEWPDTLHTSRVHPHFSFTKKRPSGQQVLKVKGISKCFGEKLVLLDVNFSVQRGERIAIIGPNGIGKSTLLKVALGKLQPDEGECDWGHETHISYFAQDHKELLNEDTTVFNWLAHQAGRCPDVELRRILGCCLFSKDDVNKKLDTLSGGEGARLLLAMSMLQHGNVLVLDEPTNHLDLEACDSLAQALREFDGTIILVSHNRHFVSQLANRIIAITHDGVQDYLGSYDEYVEAEKPDFLQR